MKKKKNSVNRNSAKQTNKLGSNDHLIDQDYPGYPHAPAMENIITPATKADRIIAGVGNPKPGKDSRLVKEKPKENYT